MRFTAGALLCGAALAAGTLVAGQVVRPSAAYADAGDDKVAELKTLEKSDEGKCVAKMQEYKDAGEPKIWAEIRNMALTSKSDKVAPAAIKMIANKPKPKDLDFLAKLVAKAEDTDIGKRKDGRPEYYKAILEGIAAYRDDEGSLVARKKALPKLLDVVKKWITTDAEYAVRAIEAYATVPDKWVVEQLLKWGEQMDSSGGGGGGGGGASGGKGPSTETRKIMGESKTAVMQALGRLTGQDIADMPSWRKWWTENEKTFKFPAAGAGGADGGGAAPAASRVPEVPEFKDEGYGYSIKRPDDKGWSWVKPDFEGCRAAAVYAPPDQGEGYLVGRLYACLHSAAKTPPHDIKAFVEWLKGDPIKTELDTGEKPVEVREEKFGGAEWTVVVAKGEGIGKRQNWGGLERRWYLTKIDTNILWIDAFVRLGAEPEVKKQFWDMCETITLPVPKKK